MKHSHKGYKLPDGLKIGERFLLSFDSASPQPGRLQDMSKDGALCIDVAPASFVQPSDSSFRLVSYLERQALQRGVQDLAPIVATAA